MTDARTPDQRLCSCVTTGNSGQVTKHDPYCIVHAGIGEHRPSNPLVAELREDSEWASLAMRMGLRRRAADEIERLTAHRSECEDECASLKAERDRLARLVEERHLEVSDYALWEKSSRENERLQMQAAATVHAIRDLEAERDRLAAENKKLLEHQSREGRHAERVEISRLRAGLEKAADTFADFRRTLILLRHHTAAEAATIAEHAIRQALAGATDETSE